MQTENQSFFKIYFTKYILLVGLILCSIPNQIFGVHTDQFFNQNDDFKARKALDYKTTTPIKYVVVIVPENATFDHYFGTYPHALNPPGEPHFKPKRKTPTPNGLSNALISHNNNLVNPFRLSRAEAPFLFNPTHRYGRLQKAAHGGLMDQFIQINSTDKSNRIQAMGYFDGNTVQALWEYAQRFAMSDNFYSTVMGPSTPGHINLISGQTHGAMPPFLVSATKAGNVLTVEGTIIGDANPKYDKCSTSNQAELTGLNVGNLLNAKDISWGWFQGGFKDYNSTHVAPNGRIVKDYVAHHQPFQYYASTANPQHLPPSSENMIGFQDQANHQYDLTDFWTATAHNNIPAVSFLKPPAYLNGHAGESDALNLQTFLVDTLNQLQQLPEWSHMAVILCWDDSGGFYDHVAPPIINQSQTTEDYLVKSGSAGDNYPFGGYQGRLGYGMRMPFLIISPYTKVNYIDHSMNDQTSVLRFIEDNWELGRIGDFSFDELAGSLLPMFNFKSPPHLKRLYLDPTTGSPINKS